MNDANHHRSLPSAKRTFSLADYTVEARGGKWFYWRTARYGDREQRKGPYGSMASVTLMIARELQREIARRGTGQPLRE